MADKTVYSMVKKIFNKQKIVAERIIAGNPSNKGGIPYISELAGTIFNEATDGNFLFKKNKTGSWIAGSFMPLQLLFQQNLLVDLTEDELKKERPFNIPLNSLIKLARQHIYLNIRDIGDFTGNEASFSERAGENLARIIEAVPDRIYIGNALRDPLFNKMNGGSNSYVEYKNYFVNTLKSAYEAFEIRLIDKPDFAKGAEFRSGKVSLAASAWHYAFLKAARFKLPNNIYEYFAQEDENKPSEIDKMIEEIGNDIKKYNKNNDGSNLLNKVTDSYLQLISYLRTFHLATTAEITGSWGSTYNRTQEEFLTTSKLLGENEGILHNPEFQNFFYNVLIDKNYIKNERLMDYATHTPYFSINDREIKEGDDGFIENLIGSIETHNNLYDALREMIVEINRYYLQKEFSVDECKKRYIEYNKGYNALIGNICQFMQKNNITIQFGYKPTISLGMIKAAIPELKLDVNVSKIIMQFFFPKEEQKIAYELKNIKKWEEK
jgi:hypothetical protein